MSFICRYSIFASIFTYLISIYYYKLVQQTCSYCYGGDIIKKLINALLTLTTFSIMTRFLGFLYKIYLSRVMTTTELGIYNLTLSIYMVAITIVSSSIPLVISRIVSLNRVSKQEYNSHYSITSSLIFSLVISIILSLLLIIAKPLITIIIGSSLGYEIILSLTPSIIFSALYAQIRGYLWGHENYFSVSMVEFIEQVLRIAFCIVMVYSQLFSSPAIAVGSALSIACFISTLYGFVIYFKKGGKFKYKKGYFKEIIHSTIPLTGVRLFSSLLSPIVAIILPIILTALGTTREFALGELGILMGMTLPLLSVPSTIIGSLCMILVPRISSEKSIKKEKLFSQIDTYILFSLMCLFIFIPIFVVIGRPACEFVFNNTQAGIYLSKCAWIIIPMGLSQITTSILNALKQEKQSFVYFVISSIFMFVTILILPKFIGILAMGYAIGISNIALSILNFIRIKHIINYPSKIVSKLLVQIIISLPVILLTWLSYNCLSYLTNTLASIILCGLISVISFFVLQFTFNIIDINHIKLYLTKTTKSSQPS